MIGKALNNLRRIGCAVVIVAVLATILSVYPKRQAHAICFPVTLPCISPYSFTADSMMAQALPDLGSALLDAEIELVTTQLASYFDPSDSNSFIMMITDRFTGLPNTGDPLQGAIYQSQSWFHAWWFYDMWPMLQDRASQIAAIEMNQARQTGAFMDAQNRNTYTQSISQRKIDIHRRHRPSDLICAVPTSSQGVMRSRIVAKALNVARTKQDIVYSGNYRGQPNANGKTKHIIERWNNYCTNYADNTSNFGTSGCPAPGSSPRKDLEYAELLFGKDTIDYTDLNTRTYIEDLKRNIIEPISTEQVPLEVFDALEAKNGWLKRRSQRAQRNVAYDAFNFMLSRRVPGSGDATFVNAIRTQAGVAVADMSTNPSYHEIMNVLTSERFKTKDYFVSLNTEPENLERELLNLNALQLVQTSDLLDATDRLSVLLAVQTARIMNKSRTSMGRATGLSTR